jgi:diaminopimelate decarboxylase
VKLAHHLTVQNGHLKIGGHDCVALSEQYGSPLYVTSEDRVVEQFESYKKAFGALYPKVQVLFAAKANGNLAIMRALAKLVQTSSLQENSTLRSKPVWHRKNCSSMAVQRPRPT